MCKLLHNSLLEISNPESADSPGARARGPQTKHEIRRLLRSSSVWDARQSIESADSSGARACQTPDKASKPASNLSEPTCKAATRVEVSPAKPKPATSPKPKPAVSIEQSSHRIKLSNRTLEAAKVFQRGPKKVRHRLPEVAAGRQTF